MSEARKKFWASERGIALRQEMSDNRKGKRLPEKALRRAAEYHSGKPLSKETKRKISAATKGRKLSEKHKRKIGEANKGVSRGKGVKKSAEHKRKIGAKSKGNKVWLGRKHKEESKRKISKGLTKAYLEGRHDVSNLTYITGYHNSPKAGRVYYRSSLELEYYKALDSEDNVKSYKVEPEAVNYEIDGRRRRYIPDLYVEYADGDWCIAEVKPSCFLEDEVVQAKVCAAEEEYGDHFEVWTELEL
jgi:hypothetical protein